ncbi:MAG: histidinol dehydrogenase, partial [Actinomycetota bacterium]|nr:histidinol dehydrogenase [Actinomycetota bacterium]
PLSAGNFVIGCPAALPTGGFAKRSSGINVEAYLKSTSIGQLDEKALARLAAATITLAEYEGFPAHANAIRVRQD